MTTSPGRKEACIALLICGTVLLGTLLSVSEVRNTTSREPEITKILAAKTLAVRTTLYRGLIERVGLSAAQEDLYHSGLPFDGEAHLLNHTAGDYAYERYGSSGIRFCKEYFLGSCFHAVIINTLAHEGLSGLSRITDCFNHGQVLAMQCAHGIGHGLLAWFGYKNLPQALNECSVLTKEIEGFPLFNCTDGVFMENVWAVHDGGVSSPDRWVKDTDAYYPCDAPSVREEWKLGCWSNQPSLLYQQFKGNISMVAAICASVPEKAYRNMCYDGLARQLHPLAGGNVESAFTLCKETGAEESAACLITISGADYAVGGRELSFGICAALSGAAQTSCYEQLLSGIQRLYPTVQAERIAQCDFIAAAAVRNDCKARVR